MPRIWIARLRDLREPQHRKPVRLIDGVKEGTALRVCSNLPMERTVRGGVLLHVIPGAEVVEFLCERFQVSQLAVGGHERYACVSLSLERLAYDEVPADLVEGEGTNASARPRATLEQAFELETLECGRDGKRTGPQFGCDAPAGHRLPGLQVATQDSTSHALVDARRER